MSLKIILEEGEEEGRGKGEKGIYKNKIIRAIWDNLPERNIYNGIILLYYQISYIQLKIK